MDMNFECIDTIIKNHHGEPGSMISILEDIQDRYHYLPKEALRMVARKTGISLVDIYGVATFYKAFSLQPRGKHLISVCLGTACHVRSAPAIVEEFTRQLGIGPGETTEDKDFTLETVNCLGACALGPIVKVDGCYFSNVKRSDVSRIIQKAKSGIENASMESDSKDFPISVCCPHCGHDLMDEKHPIEGYPSISLEISFNGTRGWGKFSGLSGSHLVEFEHPASPEVQLKFYCPHCRAELIGNSNCMDCGQPMAALKIPGGSVLLVCSQWGCMNRFLCLNGMDSSVETNTKSLSTGN